MRISAIAIVAGIAIVLILVVFLPIKPGGMPPIIQDQPQVEDKVQLNVETTVIDKPNMTDSVVSSNQGEYDFYIDEEGVKHYIINLRDTPDIQG